MPHLDPELPVTTPDALGLDFGTTNTVGARVTAAGDIDPVRFVHDNSASEVFRTVLCFWQDLVGGVAVPKADAGPWAIDRFMEEREACRFLQSIKSFAASASFKDTMIHGRRLSFEDLFETFFRVYARQAGERLASLPGRLVIGRPVTFAGGNPDEKLARQRYEAALGPFGFRDILHVYEPVAAAFFFAQRLTKAATVLVGDFGGGTSDFSIMHFDQIHGRVVARPLGSSGVGVAGDTFDQRIIGHVVAPHLGKGSRYVSFGKRLEVPAHYYVDLARWSQLALMRSGRALRDLRQLAHQSEDPAPLERLIAFIEQEQGYPLYRAVSAAKTALSSQDATMLRFQAGNAMIEEHVTRSDFEAWIAPDLARIARAVDEALTTARLQPGDIDRVFLTGGTSYVPAVRRLFTERFQPERVETGDQLVSIAYGLALIGAEQDPTPWTVPAPSH
jgi:hypothetical chaperone protein